MLILDDKILYIHACLSTFFWFPGLLGLTATQNHLAPGLP